jgi:hypothetical protein
MLNSAVLDVALGVVFAFLAVSLMTSVVVEAINSAFKTRANTLLAGIKALVNDPQFTGLAYRLYQHAAINPRGSATQPAANSPAYIDKQQFANALLDITNLSTVHATATVTGTLPTIAQFQAEIDKICDPQIKQMLTGIVARTDGKIDAIKAELANWFDAAMDRVGGAFKRRTQLWSFGIALAVSALINVDTIHLTTQLWEHPTIADALKSPVAPGAPPATFDQQIKYVTDTTSYLQTHLPIGWEPGHFFQANLGAPICDPKPQTPPGNPYCGPWNAPRDFLAQIAGWLATAIATLFGAPFWFDALQGIIRLKGAGPSPAEKANGRAAAA